MSNNEGSPDPGPGRLIASGRAADVFETSGWIDRIGQRLLVRAFRRARDRDLVDAGLDDACCVRLADVHVTATERVRIEQLCATRVTPGTPASLL